MADLKHLKLQPHGDAGGSDPLAELTRIMGMSTHSAARDAAPDDFGIDLERELMGDLGANDSHAPAAAPARGGAPERDASARSFVPPSTASQSHGPRPVVSQPVVSQPVASQTLGAQSTESWKAAFSEAANVSRQPSDAAQPRERGDAAAAPSKPAQAQPGQGAPSPAAPSTLRRDWSPARAPEPMSPVMRTSGPVTSAPVPSPTAIETPEEDPFERLAAFSRQWLDRRQPDAGGSFTMPAQPAGPASPVPTAERPKPVADPSPRPAASPSTSVPADAAPASAASDRDRRPAADSHPVPSAAPPHVAEPEPMAVAEDKVFDPFAELVAMAGHSRPSRAAPTATGPVAARPAAAPGAEGAPAASRAGEPSDGFAVPLRSGLHAAPTARGSSDAGPQNQSAVANPSIIARRTNWRSVSGGASAAAPHDAVPAAAPVIAAAAVAPVPASRAAVETPPSAAPAGPVSMARADVAPAEAAMPDAMPEPAAPKADGQAIERLAAVDLPEPPAEPAGAADMAGDPTWDAISAWVNRPSERGVRPAEADDQPRDDLDDDFFFASDAEGSPVLPPVARIPELGPVVAEQDDFGDFGEDFDLESLLRNELESESLRAEDVRVDADGAGRAVTAASAARSSPAQARSDGADTRSDEAPQAPAAASPAVAEAKDSPESGDETGMPEVDTIEVPTARYVVADEIDIPDLAVEDEVQPSVAADDIDADFGGGFEDRAETRPVAAIAATPGAAGEAWQPASPQPAGSGAAQDQGVGDIDAAFDAAVRSWAEAENEKDRDADGAAAGAVWSNVRPDYRDEDDDDGFNPEYPPAPPARQESHPVHRSRGLVVAALVAGVAVVGGVGAFVMSIGGGGGGGDTPALVRADPEPVKIKPEQPGGMTVPNQDKAVYERFSAEADAGQPAQERLVSTQEEPVNLAVRTVPITAPKPLIEPDDAESSDGLPAAFGQPVDMARPKSEDRVEPVDDIDAAPSGDVAVIAPRRVRTMVVLPDGRMVPREDAEPEAAEPEAVVVAAADPAPEVIDPAPAASTAPVPLAQAPIRTSEAGPAAAGTESGATGTIPAPAAGQEPPVRTVETRTITRDQATPTRGPVAPTRPSDQPVDIIGNTGGTAQSTQVAAATPAPVATAQSSEWSMQIASQPSPEGAQASYADLSRRYASVLNGRGVNIVKAEIAGKGTYWRVRIPTGSRADANTLCERYKAAGGSCFVSR